MLNTSGRSPRSQRECMREHALDREHLVAGSRSLGSQVLLRRARRDCLAALDQIVQAPIGIGDVRTDRHHPADLTQYTMDSPAGRRALLRGVELFGLLVAAVVRRRGCRVVVEGNRLSHLSRGNRVAESVR